MPNSKNMRISNSRTSRSTDYQGVYRTSKAQTLWYFAPVGRLYDSVTQFLFLMSDASNTIPFLYT